MTLREFPSLDPFEDDNEEEEDEDMDDVTSEATTPKEDKTGRIRRLFDNLYHRLRFLLIRAYKRYFVVPPEVGDMSHYAQCNWCKRYLAYQGWEVEFKVNEEDKINEITFRHKDRRRDKRRLGFYV